jgi:phage tail sheath protein FI
MPVAVSYPGIYVEELPSGVRPITGAATSITAFVGRALRVPTDVPALISSFGDFNRIYGGLWTLSTLAMLGSNSFRTAEAWR